MAASSTAKFPRRIIGAVVLVLLVTSISPAGAAPFVGKIQRGAVNFKVKDVHGDVLRVQVYVEKIAPQGGAEETILQVAVSRCVDKACSGSVYGKRLDPGEFTMTDGAQGAELDTSFGGAPLRVTWADDCSIAVAGACKTIGGGLTISGSSVESSNGGKAFADVSLFGLECGHMGEIEEVTLIDVAGYGGAGQQPAEPKGPPSGFRPSGGKKPLCL
ncbi:MAG TPA: hypothetical protein VNC78_12595 [Actinomycetota bacterium]|nr:hypothetical protein [Actinomycetota bacterium]